MLSMLRSTPLRTLAVVLGLTASVLSASVVTAGDSDARDDSGYTFRDDFSGFAGAAPNPQLWTMQTGGNWSGGTEKQSYTNRPSNISLNGNGSLLITARGETYTGADRITRDYTSGRMIAKKSVLYGNISARIRITGAKGAFPAFWMMGANYATVKWPACGELDVMEGINQIPNIYASFHGPTTDGPTNVAYNAGTMYRSPVNLAGDWHVYGATWTPDSVSWQLDGQTFATVLKANLPANQVWALDNPQDFILNLAVGGMAGTPAPPADFVSTMEVDWVSAKPLT